MGCNIIYPDGTPQHLGGFMKGPIMTIERKVDKKLKEVKRQLKAEQKVSERLANDVKKEIAAKKKAEEKLSPLVIENKKLTGQIAQLKKEVKELSKK